MIEDIKVILAQEFARGLPLDPMPELKPRSSNVPHAPKRNPNLTTSEEKLAIKNALRYFPNSLHEVLAPEFYKELKVSNWVFRNSAIFICIDLSQPTDSKHILMKSYLQNVNELDALCITLWITWILKLLNFPKNLLLMYSINIFQGGNGAVFQNWAQYHLAMHYLSVMNDNQTLVLASGHPQGLYPSSLNAPRMVITNGMMVPNYSSL